MRKQGAKFKSRINPHAMFQAFRSVEPIEQSQAVDLGVAYWQAFAAIRGTWAKEEHYHTLAASINIAMVLCEQGVMPQAIEEMKSAQLALMLVADRAERTHVLGFNANEMAAIKEALLLHDMQLQAATKQQTLDAVQEVIRRKKAGDTIKIERVV